MVLSLRSVVPALRCPCAPLSLRSVVPALLMMGLMLAAPHARAGSYVGAFVDPASQAPTQYSGGTYYAPTSSPPAAITYGTVPDTVTSGSYGGDSNGYPGRSDCSHPISTSWKWVPAAGLTMTSDPPPTQVIILQTCSVYVSVGQVGASGTYKTGLGKSGGVSLNPPGSGGIGSAADTVYSVVAGGASVSLPSLDASATVPASPSESRLSYTASIFPVTISLGGAIQDNSGNYNILIGQGCSASMSAGPATLSNFQWTIPGETFKSFVMGTTPGTLLTNPKPYGRVNYLASADTTSPTPYWFWKKGADFGTPQTVSCTATASINGTAIGSVTGTKTVNVWQPYFLFSPNAQGVNLVGNSVPNVSIVGNIVWNGAVGTPYLFFSNYLSYGIWQYTQLCNIAVVLKDPLLYYSNTNGSVLDAEFNYSSKSGAPWAANSTSAVPHQESDGDAPTIGLGYFSNDTYTGTWDTYMMYQPPGTNVSWVPLYKCEWAMTSVVDLINGVYTPNPPGTLTISSNAPSSAFPVWEDYFPDASH